MAIEKGAFLQKILRKRPYATLALSFSCFCLQLSRCHSLDTIIIGSAFISEHTSFKKTSQEFLVVIGVALKSGKSADFTPLLSDYRDPNEYMNGMIF